MEENGNGSERRHSEIELEKRLTRLETTQDFILQQGKETHDAMVKGMEDLYGVFKPVQDALKDQAIQIAENANDIKWHRRWLWGIGSSLVGGITVWLDKHFT